GARARRRDDAARPRRDGPAEEPRQRPPGPRGLSARPQRRGAALGEIPYGRLSARCDDWTMASVGVSPGQPGSDESPPAGEGPGPARSRRRAWGREPLRRHPDRGLIGGVCVGIAESLGLDVAPVRIGMALLMAVGGIGVALYALMWALIPVAPESEGRPRRP